MTEILDLSNSIATSKENIRQALVARGVTCPNTTPLADFATKINNMVVSGNVDNLFVTNYSGKEIKTGDKIYIKPDKNTQSLSYININSQNAYTSSLVSPDGNICMYDYSDYKTFLYLDWNNTTLKSSSSDYWGRYDYMNNIKYDLYGQMWLFHINLSYAGFNYTNLGYNHFNSKYSLKTSATAFNTQASSGSAAYIYEYDKNNEITKTFNFNLPGNCNASQTYGVVINNYLLISFSGTAYTYYAQIPENDGDNITFTSTGKSNLFPIGVTNDQKYVICCNNQSPSAAYIKFRKIDNDIETFGTNKTFNNADLAIFTSVYGVFASFNPANQVLCLTRYTKTNTMSDIGLFKYNPTTEDWDTITPDLTAYYAAGDVFNSTYDKGCISISNDCSKISYGRNIFNLPYTSTDGYIIVSDSLRNTMEDVLTAIALENCDAKAGSTCNVKVILP